MYRQFIADGVGVPLSANLSQGGKRASRGAHPELDDEDLFGEGLEIAAQIGDQWFAWE